jgi:hypothetical protein
MPTLERIQNVIVSGVLGFGLSVMMAAPSVAQTPQQPVTKEDLKGIQDSIRDLNQAIKGLQPQIDSLNYRMDKIERRDHTSYPPRVRPTPAYPPKRVVHIHRHYYRYWCPPWWY